ncbi:MAG: multidrug efflux SMR transporter [Rouxiella aceris]|jgi:small multidrug resistance pump|uniref:Multidrug efflux SMR transporter n=1 Tax=Rouxiella aceris TaxID=2703884 RepID=A0A848MPI5_9GAMM|nr:multidrug efflux SMR transporter [Rouxiella aceris]MDR3434971.1 multidrug efflux SMR transporter [Rouxiella aceris]NMP29243.1 multidrug efflux SMR transporter [Rouxiella aceris]
MTYLYLFIAIISEVIATSSLKASAGFTRLYPSIAVVVGYILSFILLSLVLKSMPVGIAYAIWAGMGIVLVACAGFVFFGQKLDAYAIGGMVLIIAGVLMINLLSKTAGH